MKNVYQTVIFDTFERSPISKWTDNSLYSHDEVSTKNNGSINQHLCVISDEKLKIGDWVLCDFQDKKKYEIGKILKEIEPEEGEFAWEIEYLNGEKEGWEGYACQKLISTTVKSKKLPLTYMIKKEFIREYVMANSNHKTIKEVAVEFEKDGSANITELNKNQLPTIDECLYFAWDEIQKSKKAIAIDSSLLMKIIKYSQGY